MKKNIKGFTLLEILLVIALIGLLVSIVLLAINPNRQISQLRNLQRKSDINNIYNAMEQYTIKNKGVLLTSIQNNYKKICNTGTATSGSTISSCNNNEIDLRVLVPNYLTSIPIDPFSGDSYELGVSQYNNKLCLRAKDAELGEKIFINGCEYVLNNNITFNSTSIPNSWYVSKSSSGNNVSNNSDLNSFLSNFPQEVTFAQATTVNGRDTSDVNWIANNDTGTNTPNTWTQFIFKQSFELIDVDPSKIQIRFRWTADDIGNNISNTNCNDEAGNWIPKYRLNEGQLIQGVWTTNSDGCFSTPYIFSDETTISNGFKKGTNTIEFYVQGNGTTDGISVQSLGVWELM